MSRFSEYINDNGVQKLVVHKPFVAHCGCGGIVNSISAIISNAGYGRKRPTYVRPNADPAMKQYLTEHGYYNAIPELNNPKYIVMIDPKTTKFISVYGKPASPGLYVAIKEVLGDSSEF